jgi:hypothetical protein
MYTITDGEVKLRIFVSCGEEYTFFSVPVINKLYMLDGSGWCICGITVPSEHCGAGRIDISCKQVEDFNNIIKEAKSKILAFLNSKTKVVGCTIHLKG